VLNSELGSLREGSIGHNDQNQCGQREVSNGFG